MPTAYDMMLSLKEMFGDQNRAARLVAMKDLMNTTMFKGIPVRDHVLNIISLMNKLKILGSEIDVETQVDIILQSLFHFFKQFCLNYNMNKFFYSLAELIDREIYIFLGDRTRVSAVVVGDISIF